MGTATRRKGASAKKSAPLINRVMILEAPPETSDPARIVQFKLDAEAWIDSLTGRDQKLFALLWIGVEGFVIARVLGVSPGRVSQMKLELEKSFREFMDC